MGVRLNAWQSFMEVKIGLAKSPVKKALVKVCGVVAALQKWFAGDKLVDRGRQGLVASSPADAPFVPHSQQQEKPPS